MKVGGQCHTLATLCPQISPGIHFTEGWEGLGTGLDWTWRRQNLLSPLGFEPWTI